MPAPADESSLKDLTPHQEFDGTNAMKYEVVKMATKHGFGPISGLQGVQL